MKSVTFTRNQAAMVFILAAILGCSKSSSPPQSVSTSGNSLVLSSTDAKFLADSVVSSVDSNTANSVSIQQGGASNILLPQLGTNLEAILLGSLQNCVSENAVSATDATFTFACPNLTGTAEFNSSSSSSAGNSLSISDNLKLTGNSGGSITFDDSATITKTVADVVTLTEQSDDTIATSTDTYVLSSQGSYTYSPDNTSSPWSAGSISLNASVDLNKDGSDLGTLTVSSNALHRSTCGLDAGSLEIQNANNDIVITYSGCGNRTATDNGQPITL